MKRYHVKYFLFIILFVAAIVTAGCVSENKNNTGALTPTPPPFASPAESGNVKLIGGFPIGVSDEIVEYNGFVFIGHGEFVMVYNLTPYSRIKNLKYNDYSYRLDAGAGNVTDDGIVYQRGIVRGMVQDRGYLYTGSDTGITIWDISHLSTSGPVRLSKYHLGGECWDVQIDDSGNYLYVAKGSIKIFNVTDKTNPEYVRSFGTSYRRIALKESYIYTAGKHDTPGVAFSIWDISDPTNPRLSNTTTLKTAGSLTGIWSDGEYAYIADYKNYVGIVKVTNKAAPEVVNLKAATSSVVCPVDLKGRENKLYVSGRYNCGGGGGLYVYDITNRTSLTRIMTPKSGSVPGIGYTEGIALGEKDNVWVAENTYGIAYYNISGFPAKKDPDTILYLGGNIDTIVALNNDVLLCGDHNDAIWTFDISDPNNVTVLQRLGLKGRFNGGIGVTPDKRYAFFPKVMYADYDNPLGRGGFFVVDISDPANMKVVNVSGGQTLATHGAYVTPDGNILYTNEGVFNIRDPTKPRKVYTGYTSLGPYVTRPSGTYIIRTNGSHIIVSNQTKVSAPSTETAWTKTWINGSDSGSITVSSPDGNLMMGVAHAYSVYHISSFDISDVSNITRLKTRSYSSGYSMTGISIDPKTHMAYTIESGSTIRSWNVADPSNFYEVDKASAYGNNYGGWHFDKSSGRIFTGWETGIFIFQTSYNP